MQYNNTNYKVQIFVINGVVKNCGAIQSRPNSTTNLTTQQQGAMVTSFLKCIEYLNGEVATLISTINELKIVSMELLQTLNNQHSTELWYNKMVQNNSAGSDRVNIIKQPLQKPITNVPGKKCNQDCGKWQLTAHAEGGAAPSLEGKKQHSLKLKVSVTIRHNRMS